MENNLNKEENKSSVLMLGTVITDFDCCPHCGSSYGYYTKVKSKGLWHDTTMFFDHKTKENTEMMDGFVDTWESKQIYCSKCNKAICKRSE